MHVCMHVCACMCMYIVCACVGMHHNKHRKPFYFTASLTLKGDEEVSKAIVAALPCELMSRGANDLLCGCINGNRFYDKIFYYGYEPRP